MRTSSNNDDDNNNNEDSNDDNNEDSNNDNNNEDSNDDDNNDEDSLSAPPDPSIVDYVIEGIADLDDDSKRHMRKFYKLLLPKTKNKANNSTFFFKEKHSKIIECLEKLADPQTTESSLRRQGFTQVTAWKNKYALVGNVLVQVPNGKDKVNNKSDNHNINDDNNNDGNSSNDSSNENDNNTNAANFTRPSYYERVFADLKAAHGDDHTKCTSLFKRVNKLYSNIPRDVQKLFTSTCPMCIGRCTTAKKPVAGLKCIISYDWGQRGQMDIIDLRSIADGDFKYLLNYIDHCTKYLFCIPLKSKTARVVAQALVQIFTIIGPPKILQTDNGGEFVGVAYTDKEIRCMQLDDAVRLPTFSYIFSYSFPISLYNR